MYLPNTKAVGYSFNTFMLDPTGTTYSNYPSANTMFLGSGLQFLVNLLWVDQVRINVMRGGTASSAGSKVSLRGYSSPSLNPSNFVNIGESSTDVVADVETANTNTDSGWVNLDKSLLNASGDIYLAFIAHGGNGVADPKFVNLNVEFRSEAEDKAHICADMTSSAQKFRIWMNRDGITVPNPLRCTVLVETTGGTYQGSKYSDSPDDLGIFTIDTDLSLSAATTYTVKVVVEDSTGTISGEADIDTE